MVRLKRRRAVTLSLASGAVIGAAAALRRPMLDWGSSPEEAARALPGDDLLPHADLVATRAITISAPPQDVWPWLIQIGTGRAGAYSYDVLDRLAGLDMHSSQRIIPEYQNLGIGDVIPVANDGTGLRVHILEPNRVLGTLSDDGTWAWTWILEPLGERTRLLSRTRMDTRSSPPLARLGVNALLIPASWIMERKMLLGLRERAENSLSTDVRD